MIRGPPRSARFLYATHFRSWSVPGVVVNANTQYTAVGHGIAPNGVDITYPAYPDERDQVTVDVYNPSTMVTLVATPPGPILVGSAVTLTVTEANNGTGAAPLTGPYVDLPRAPGGEPLPLVLNKAS